MLSVKDIIERKDVDYWVARAEYGVPIVRQLFKRLTIKQTYHMKGNNE